MFFAFLLLFVTPFFAPLFAARVLTLDSVLAQIDRGNVSLAAYEKRARGLVYLMDVATAWAAPMVGAGTFMTPFPGQKTIMPANEGSVMLEIEQRIPNLIQQKAQREVYAAQAKSERMTRAIARNELRARARLWYYTYLITERKIKVLTRDVGVLETMHEISTLRYQNNRGRLGDVYVLEATQREVENNLWIAKQTIREAQSMLMVLMNRQNKKDSFWIDTATRVRFEIGAHDRITLAREKQDVQKIKIDIDVMEKTKRAILAEAKPEGKVRFSYMQTLGRSVPVLFSAIGMVSIPIVPWASKSYKNKYRAIDMDIQAKENEMEDNLTQSLGVLDGLVASIGAMEDKIKNTETIILPTLRKNWEADLRAYRENTLSLPTLMGSWRALNQTELDLISEEFKFYQMIIRYDKELYR